MSAANYDVSSLSISADAVRVARFSTKRHGWDEKEVRAFLDAVANDIQAADSERASLRAELKSSGFAALCPPRKASRVSRSACTPLAC